jgi:FtsJ-like methyltransferase
MARSGNSREEWDQYYDDPTYDLITPSRGVTIIRSSDVLPLPAPLDRNHSSHDIELFGDLVIGKPNPYQSSLVSQGLIDKRDELRRLYSPRITDPLDLAVRRLANPFYDIGSSIFLDGGIEMANMDAVFNFGSGKAGYSFNRSVDPIVFLDLGGTPGGITQYIQWRYPNAFGYGVALSSEQGGKSWNKNLDSRRFTTTYCMDGSGNATHNATWITNWVMKTVAMSPTISNDKLLEGRGVDLVHISSDSNTDSELESLNSILAKILIGINVLWTGGSMIIKVGDLFSMTADLIYLMIPLFDYVTLFKPISSDPENSESYVIAKGFSRNNTSKRVAGLLTKANNAMIRGDDLSRLTDRSSGFDQQMKQFNDMTLKRQITYWKSFGRLTNQRGRNKSFEDIVPIYLTYYATVYWNIPN